jgi:invasion protein IalB
MSARHFANCAPLLLSSMLSIAFSALGVVAGPTPTFGQPAAPRDTTSSAAAGTPEISPRGQRLAREITYGDWRKFCFKPGGAKITCRTTISGNWETGQQAVRLDLIEREGEGSARLQLFLPVGLYLPAGVKLTIDRGAPYSIPYTWCLINTCIAADVADPKAIREMEAGQKLAVEVIDSNLLSVTTALPLNQFPSVHLGAPSRIFDQALDE